jgi:uncharacterized protein (DUF1015 family)
VARFRPFRGIRYAAAQVGDLAAVVAPPYDVISPAQRDVLWDTSPFNVTRLILNKDGHDAAAEQWRQWRGAGVLDQDDQPCFYLYAQDFEARGPRRRVGVLGALHLEAFRTGVVLRHETTFAHHKQDRLELTRRAKANLSPIFGTFSNPDFNIEPDGGWDAEPAMDVTHQGVRHRMWVLRAPEKIAAVEAALAGRSVYIADGHHRYETALNYYMESTGNAEPPTAEDAPGDEQAPVAHVLAFLAAFEDPGMVILPTHRELVSSGGADAAAFQRALEEGFEVRRFARDAAGRSQLLGALESTPPTRNGFAVAMRDLEHYLYVVREAERSSGSPLAELDVKVLHESILDGALRRAGATGEPELAYSVDADALLDRVDAGALEGCFLMNATRPEQMAAVCEAGELMPQKSTYFFPKLLSGVVFHSLVPAD